MTTIQEIDWTKIGQALRESAIDAHGAADIPTVDMAYSFLLDNPECFGEFEEWPLDMPQQPNIELIAAYYVAEQGLAPAPATEDEYVWIKIGIRRPKPGNGDGWDLTIGEHTFANQGSIDVENYCRIAVSNALDTLTEAAEEPK